MKQAEVFQRTTSARDRTQRIFFALTCTIVIPGGHDARGYI